MSPSALFKDKMAICFKKTTCIELTQTDLIVLVVCIVKPRNNTSEIKLALCLFGLVWCIYHYIGIVNTSS